MDSDTNYYFTCYLRGKRRCLPLSKFVLWNKYIWIDIKAVVQKTKQEGWRSRVSKKSYKRNQNRLYREIKRRITAEQVAKFPVPVIEISRDIETLAIRNIVPNYFVREIEFIKTDMANEIARKLVAEGYVEFFSSENKYEPIADVTEIEARIRVVKPAQKGR